EGDPVPSEGVAAVRDTAGAEADGFEVDLDAALAADLEAVGDRGLALAPAMERRGQVRVTLSAAPEALRQLQYVGVTGALLCLAAVLVLRRLLRDAARELAP